MAIFQGCSSEHKDPYSLAAGNVNADIRQSDVGYIDEGYEWGFGNLGFMLNGHGLPDQRRTFVITHRSATGKTELIWPVFCYGDNQANAEVLDHTLVFTGMLPDGRQVLMTHRAGEPPVVVTTAVLRMAMQRLGTNVIVPGTQYYFTKVRQPPDRIWLKGQPVTAANSYPPTGEFALDLTAEDLRNVIEETRYRAKPCKASAFDYLAEDGTPIQISNEDVAATKPRQALERAPTFHKSAGYIPRNENLTGDVLFDPANHYAYFSTFHEPGRILKVAPGTDANTLPTVTGAAVLEGEEDKPFSSVIDVANGYGYFGTEFPGHLVKVALGSSNTPPYRVGSVLVEKNWNVGAGVLDSAQGVACFQVGPRFIKFRLGKGDRPPTIISQTDIPKEVVPVSFNSVAFDPVSHIAYFGSDLTIIYKVAIGDGDAPPRFLGSIKLSGDQFGLRGALIDPMHGYGWFTSQNGYLAKVALGESNGPPRLIGSLKFGSQFQYSGDTFGMDDAGYAYLGTGGGGKAGDPECCTGGVLKIALGKGDELPRIVSFMPLSDGISISEGFVDPSNRTLVLGVTEAAKGCKLLKINLADGDAAPKIIGETDLYLK